MKIWDNGLGKGGGKGKRETYIPADFVDAPDVETAQFGAVLCVVLEAEVKAVAELVQCSGEETRRVLTMVCLQS